MGARGGVFCPLGRLLAMSGDILGCHSWGLGGCYWHLVAKARHPTTHRTAPTTKSYPAPNINSSAVEKPWPRGTSSPTSYPHATASETEDEERARRIGERGEKEEKKEEKREEMREKNRQ